MSTATNGIVRGAATWQQTCEGFAWRDMPGHSDYFKRCNFALFRRGLLTPADVLNVADGPVKRRILEVYARRKKAILAIRAAQRRAE